VASPAQHESAPATHAADSLACENCGESLPANAVLCVHCGYDLRQGQVLSRTPATKEKKSAKNRKGPRLAVPKPAIVAIAAGALVLIGAGLFFALRGGSPSGKQPTADQGPGTAAAVSSARVVRPDSSRDPKDWQSSFPAFAANFSVQELRDSSGRPRWALRSGQISLAQDAAPIRWEGVLMGRDRRSIVSSARSDVPRQAVGFGFPELAALPDPFAILFSIDENRAADLLKLSYRWVRIEGKLDPVPRVVWVNLKGYQTDTVAGPPLRGGEPVNLDLPDGEAVRPIYVMWFDISRFELAK